MQHTVQRCTLYDNIIKLYQSGEIIKESPIFIAYDSELAVDEGGVTRDMYSAFWGEAYSRLFDGATILIPLVHAQTYGDISHFRENNFPWIPCKWISSSSYITSFTYNYASWSFC